MPPKKSVEELDAELAALEAELAALEAGEGAPPKPKKKKAKAAPPPPPAPEAPPEAAESEAAEAPASRLPLRLPKRDKPAGDAPKRRFGLPFGKGAREDPAEPEAAAEPVPEALPEPEPEAAPPPPAPAGPAVGWEGKAGAWRARPQGPQKVEVVRRELDASGHVLSEESLGEEVEAAPAAEPAPQEAPPRRFGFFGGAPEPEAAPASTGEAPPPRRKGRRSLLLLPALLIVAILLLALVLPALGVDPLGIGSRVGVGGGGTPTAAFSVSANVVAIGDLVTFDAGLSRDPSGGLLEYNWEFDDGSGAQGARVTHAYQAAGEYRPTLTVRGPTGRTATAADDITVVAPPTARMAIALGGSPLSAENSAMTGDELAFTAAGSTGTGAINYEWLFGDGGRASGAEASHAYTAAGSYRVTLTVTDANGLRANATAPVFVGQRLTEAGQAEASLQGAVAVNTTLTVASGGGALPYAPARLTATLTWNATGGGSPLPIPIPGLPADNLRITVYDAAGAIVATSEGDASPEELVVTDFGGFALGAWTVEVSRSQGGAQPIPYQLEVALANGPG